MDVRRISPGLIAGLLVTLSFGLALYIRIGLPYDQIFVGDWIKFASVDAYHFIRHVDSQIHNFPHQLGFDPYLGYPHGAWIGSIPFVWLLSGIIWLVGLGAPTQHTIDVVGVYFPAVVGTLAVIPVYFIGKELFHRWAGVIAAGLFAILPGELLGRTILGFTDRDALMVLFTCLVMLFLILAVKASRRRQVTFSSLKQRDWKVIVSPLLHSFFAGGLLGLYVLTWRGAFVFVLIIFVYFIIQFMVDHLNRKPTDYLVIIGSITFFATMIVVLPSSPSPVYLAPLVIALLTPAALYAVSLLITWRKLKATVYPLALLVLGLTSLGALYLISPGILKSIIGGLGVFVTNPVMRTTLEMQPILFPNGEFSLAAVWGNFTTASILGLIALAVLVYQAARRGEPDKMLFLVWCLVILAATLAMRRFSLFFSINVALLTAYLSWLALSFVGLKEAVPAAATTQPPPPPRKAKKARRKQKIKKQGSLTARPVYIALVAVVLFFVVFFPNISRAKVIAGSAFFVPSDAWCESLDWLKDNTPDPFGNPDFYYETYETPFRYPETAYGIMAWWDYGYWIIRIAHRPVVCSPGMGDREPVARFFTAQDEASAIKIAESLDTRYVIIDNATATGKFHAMVTYAGAASEDFYDVYYMEEGGQLVPGRLFYPEYYRTLVARLYNFDGSAVEPSGTWVVSYEDRLWPDGSSYRQATNLRTFSSYEEAEDYVASQASGNHRIVGTDPFVSPVPLEPLVHHRLVYSSKNSIWQPNIGPISEVKIFEYTKSE